MISLDPRSGPEKDITTVDRMVSIIHGMGIECDKQPLEFGDAAFEGNSAEGRVLIGVERKTLHDLLHCIDDSRLVAHQLPGMISMYKKSFLLVEGSFKPHDPDGWLMESYSGGWGPCRYRSQKVRYSKVRRYLLSIELSGIPVLYTRDLWHTCFDLCELYSYYQKRWEDHTSLLETQKLVIPSFTKPTLVRRWASEITDIGVKFGLEAEKMFRRPITLANASALDWCKIKGVGMTTARKIIKEIQGD